jgi:membrane-bound lytic murein transglycosylase D
MLAARLSPNEIFAGQPEPRRYRVRNGDTLASVAQEYGLTPTSLALANRIRTSAKLRPGRTLVVPEARPAAGLVASVTPAPAQLAPAEPITNGIYVVQNGDSLADIAKRVGLSEDQLLKINDLRNRDFIFEGQQLTVRPEMPPPVASTGAPASTGGKPVEATPPPVQVASAVGAPVGAGAVPAAEAERESAEDAAAVASQRAPEENAQPVSAAQAEEISPALGPAAESQQSADPTDYSVGKDDTIEVAAAETLGHYADWLSVSAQRLRQINRMSHGRPVVVGRRLKLDFARVSREDFEKKRREYHQTLQAAYFAAHRIVGSEVYIVRRGDSLWTVTQRFSQLPIWLLRQYNPDLDLADLRPGTQVVMPRVEDVVANGT